MNASAARSLSCTRSSSYAAWFWRIRFRVFASSTNV